MNNNDRQRTDVLDDDGAPHAAEQRRPPSASPIGAGKAKSPEQRPMPDAAAMPIRNPAPEGLARDDAGPFSAAPRNETKDDTS